MLKWYNRYMIVVTLLLPLFVFLQAGQIFYTQNSSNVSLGSYILLILLSLSWVLYGVITVDLIIIISTFLVFVGSVLALVGCLYYRPASSSLPGPFTSV